MTMFPAGKKLFITGGTGFFGKNLFLHLPELSGCSRITLLSRRPEVFFKAFPGLAGSGNIDILRGDVRSFQCGAEDYDYIIHGAAAFGAGVPDAETRSVILDGTGRVLDFARRNAGLEKLLYLSSGAVYGRKLAEIKSEDSPCCPAEPYGESKLEAERLCLGSGVPCSVARCFAFVGEFMELGSHFAIGNFIGDCLANRPVVIRGDGTAVRSFLYSGDLARQLAVILVSGRAGRIYNVGSDEALTIRELAERVRAAAGTANEIRVAGTPRPGTPPDIYVPDVSRLRLELDIPDVLPLSAALAETLDFYRPLGVF